MRLIAPVVISILGLLAYATGNYWTARPGQTVYEAAAPGDCDLATGPCTAVFPDGASIRLRFDADRLTPLLPLSTSAITSGIDVETVDIEFSGVDMNMGLIRQVLDRNTDGTFANHVTLPVCVRGSMQWHAYVTAHGNDADYRASFLLEMRR